MSETARPRRALEFFSGLGGFATAARRAGISVVAAYDQDRSANETYACNFGHIPEGRTLEGLREGELPFADLWWMSPPCTPFTTRGKQAGLDDPRARPFADLVQLASRLRPAWIMIENVPGIVGSAMHTRVRETLGRSGYHMLEILLCPSELGIPMRRRRWFLVASLSGPPGFVVPRPVAFRDLASFLDPHAQNEAGLAVDPALIARYAGALDLVDPALPGARAACFTRAYGKSPVRSGSYLAAGEGMWRRFSPGEILALMGFDVGYRFPAGMDLRRRWQLLGNTLSVPCVEALLGSTRRDSVC